MDADHHAGDLLGAFRLEHLEALMPAHDIPRDLVPDDGIHIPEIVQGAPDFLVSWVARLQILAGIIFCRFQHENGHFLNVYFRLYRWQKAHKINPFERPGAIFCVPKKHFIFAKYFTAGRPGPGENAPGDSIPPGAAKPTTPQDFPQAKCKSRLHPGTFARRSAKADNALDFAAAKCESRPACPEFRTAKRESRPGRRTFLRRSAKADPGGRLCPGPGFWPRDRPRRRKRFASLYRAEKPVFTKRRRSGDGKSYLVRPFVACFLAPGERN